jgi:hypothetical protein
MRGPALRDELGKSPEAPAGFELADNVDEVLVRIDTEEQAVVDERESGCQPRASADRTGEKKPPSRNGKQPEPAFDPPVVDLERPSSQPRHSSILVVLSASDRKNEQLEFGTEPSTEQWLKRNVLDPMLRTNSRCVVSLRCPGDRFATAATNGMSRHQYGHWVAGDPALVRADEAPVPTPERPEQTDDSAKTIGSDTATRRHRKEGTKNHPNEP